MAQGGCSATRCLARRSVVGALLASTASVAAAGPAKASRTQRKLTGYVMDDGTIRTAVAAWFDDRSGAKATYGHISTWATGGVTDMAGLFDVHYNSGAASFNEDISAWDTSGVTSMNSMFYSYNEASAFNQDISGWVVDSVTDMSYMFAYTDAFDQDLGWCLDDDVHLGSYAFYGTPCESTSCGILHTAALSCGGKSMGDGSIRTAVAAWILDATAAEATYGHISTWETGGVTDMSFLFCGTSHDYSYYGYCNTAAASFNEDIGAWDTSGATTMRGMFYEASSFNQDIGAWEVENVEDMRHMFYGASFFDQDLGWCVDDDVYLDDAFGRAGGPCPPSPVIWCVDPPLCASTSCGVAQPENYGDCNVASTGNVMVSHKLRWAVSAWLADATAAEATYGHISTWETSGVTDMSGLFCAYSEWSSCNTAAASFNEDIGAWDTSGVTTMYAMFRSASAFNQDFGWCLDDDVDLLDAFDGTPCESTSCGVLHTAALSCGGTPMGDESIRTAVAAWISDATAAEATYGHISTWATGGVTDMAGLFDVDYNSAAASFNEDISSWDTSSVTTMYDMFWGASAFNQDLSEWKIDRVTDMSGMFHGASSFNQPLNDSRVDKVKEMQGMFGGASSFNQPLGNWRVDSLTDMSGMFYEASAFDQDLGWCVDDDADVDRDGNGYDMIVDIQGAFTGTQCESTYCGVMWETNAGDCDVPRTGNVMVNWKIKQAVAGWVSDATAAEATYGHISTWETSGVTDMSDLFRGASSFNEDIGAWDTSGVRTMYYMFFYASAFDQDLGWCVDGDVSLFNAFGPIWDEDSAPRCASTSCGVKQVAGGCAPSPAPTSPTPIVDAAHRLSAGAALLALALI